MKAGKPGRGLRYLITGKEQGVQKSHLGLNFWLLLLECCVALGKLLHLSEPHYGLGICSMAVRKESILETVGLSAFPISALAAENPRRSICQECELTAQCGITERSRSWSPW